MAAAKLCCAVPLRSESPDDTPSRPVRHFKSLANIKTHFAHGRNHAPVGTDGHTDENLPLYSADDLELQRIFVAASLPEDHPDAIRMNHRKPEVDESIIRSPSFKSKLRRQLSRKSLATGKASREIIKKPMLKPLTCSGKQIEHRFTDLAAGYDDDAQSLCLTDSHLASFQHNDSAAETYRPKTTSLEGLDASSVQESDEPRRSISVPLTSHSSSSVHRPRRSQSSSDPLQGFKEILTVHLPGPTFIDANEIWPLSPTTSKHRHPQSARTSATNNGDNQSIMSFGPRLPSCPSPPLTQSRSRILRPRSRDTAKSSVTQKVSSSSLHLHDMQISQHLRTRSQLSDASCASDSDRQTRITHASLNSVMLSSLDQEYRVNKSNPSFAFSAVPSTWEQVLKDESSSVYSRRPSTTMETPSLFPIEPPSEPSKEDHHETPAKFTGIELINCNGQPVSDSPERIVSASTGISVLVGETLSSQRRFSQSSTNLPRVSIWPAHDTTCSLPKSDSSGSLGKLSRFKEDLTESSGTAKPRKKHRSVLRVLFPRLVRSKLRSASTPLLSDKVPSSGAGMYDGPGDAQDLLAVPQSLSRKHSGDRSVSFSNLRNARPASGSSNSNLTVGASSLSRKSLMEYERTLSIIGDDRRRKSTLGVPKVPEHDIDVPLDTPEPGLRRASPLSKPGRKGTEETLMEKALQQHQLEKAALIRSSNHKAEVIVPSVQAPVFKSPFSSLFVSESKAAVAMEDLDPLDAEGSSAAQHSPSTPENGQPQNFSSGSPRFSNKKDSDSWTMKTAASEETKAQHQALTPPSSWSQFPSHTRERRCSTASRADGIISRDFAYAEEVHSVHQPESLDDNTNSPKSWPRQANVRKRNWIVKSRSMTFGTVLRYYSSLLTSSAARNRRSSTATGGRLEHPELEVLPSILPPHTDVSQHTGAKDHFARFVEHVREEGHHLREEGHDILAHHHHHKPSPLTKKLSAETVVRAKGYQDEVPSTDSQQEETTPGLQKSAAEKAGHPLTLDSATESRPVDLDRALSARRLSRMYQAYVQLPTSLDSTEVEQSEVADDSTRLFSGPGKDKLPLEHSDLSKTGFLVVPSTKPRMYSGPVVRHFPSATVVDDCRGHWRSVSLMSVDSGKSVRKSTRDLLESVKAMETQELERLMSKLEMTTTGEHGS